jgi:flagella basal body P-ring formation protein FlgA
MTMRYLVTCLWLVPCALAQTPCLTVTGEQITGSDMARAVPAFAKIPRDAPLAPSPLPGSARVFNVSEMQSLASRFSVAVGQLQDVCFRFATETLSTARIAEAMREALRIPDARLEVLETLSGPTPVGTLEFVRKNLSAPAAPDQKTPVVWRGDILYAGNRRFPIWAKVRITAPIVRLVAVESLRSGLAIKADQVRSELTEGFPADSGGPLSAEQVAGMIPLRPVPAGADVRMDNLKRANDINRGDLVHVEVRFGAAHLALTGRAESAGHVGDTITVRNPDSSKTFEALVDGVGRVVVGHPGAQIASAERE